MTSHDVVGRVRRALGEQRVGHAGTLDPEASGVLVVGVGQATRIMGLLTQERKSYETRILFGAETSTDDAEGEVVRRSDVPSRLSGEADAIDALAGMVGTYDQVPPSYSAISVGGRRAYDRARAGEVFELDSRSVSILSASLQGIGHQDGDLFWDCAFTVSKGCYIRSIARDLGRTCGTAAHVVSLRRTSSGPCDLGRCTTLDLLGQLGPARVAEVALDPTWALGYPTHALDEAGLADVRCGRPLDAPMELGDGGMCSLVCGGLLYGVWYKDGPRLVSKATFPDGIIGVGGGV
ncbi:MAG: tRNA pseudouridine(55) synthase TruB [Atopobiaceae bacterium]|jgi:tRNA pseudouridine55 synthase|nr:tRNA pseudouridine(55) synthase TruB [Atopobiaceae bacterium]MCH4214025.1 tRNA pseudouridine(55) synthase TruB [Atopobiaceae bacterium]MCH4276861.1 tRNA pseudouridine(55) synthase TruB [Atopobiaceae bacterium]MCI1260431.1 tRNA pseudouridine(55) synthase TruB [Atopobiaceae bacterium]